jgi:hypothetical protein
MIRSIVCDNCLPRELQHFLRHGMATMECSRMYGKITLQLQFWVSAELVSKRDFLPL